ncbi:MAG: hypothetical protein U0892_11920 [Pirellulales bacterium]
MNILIAKPHLPCNHTPEKQTRPRDLDASLAIRLPMTMINQNPEATSEEAAATRLTPESLLNLLVKALGLYWFIYGVLTCVETAYSWYLDRIKDMINYADSDPYTTVWGVAMLIVGAWLIVYSKWTTRLAYSFDKESRLPDEVVD